MPKTNFSTDLSFGQFSDHQNIKRRELSDTCRRLIKRKEEFLDKICRRIWMAKNPNDEAFIFSKFTSGGDETIVTLASYIPRVGFVTSQ